MNDDLGVRVFVGYGPEHWIDKINLIEKWLLENYPDRKRFVIGTREEEWDWYCDIDMRDIRVTFKDPALAIVFKLAWGGK